MDKLETPRSSHRGEFGSHTVMIEYRLSLKLNPMRDMGRLSEEGCVGSKHIIPQTVLALRGSDGFSRDLWRRAGVSSRSSAARSCCKNRYLVTLTFAPLERNRGSRAQTHQNSMVFVNYCTGPRYGRQAASDAADVCC